MKLLPKEQEFLDKMVESAQSLHTSLSARVSWMPQTEEDFSAARSLNEMEYILNSLVMFNHRLEKNLI